MITILLAVIALSEVTRLILTHKPTTKKAHFKLKFDSVKKMIYDLEFKRFKTKEIREGVRGEYTFMKSRIQNFEEQIKNWGKKDVNEKKRVEDQKVLAERDLQRFEAQLKQLDVEIDGIKPNSEYTNGHEGITQQIESLQELLSMLKDWIKRC